MLTKWLPKWVFAALCLCAFVCSAQTAQPIFQPHVTFVDGSGNPCAGCSLYSYAAGTTTPQATYTDATEATQNPNPVVLDAAGGAAIWVGSSGYKFALLNTYGTTLWTVDNVLAPTPGGTGLYLLLSGGTMSGTIAMAGNNITNVGAIGVGTTSPAWPLDVENGAINSSGGYLYNGSAPLNHILKGDGAHYVDSASFPYASLTGTPTLYYQTVDSNSVAQTQRPTLNFSSRFNVTDSASPAQTTIDLPTSPVTPGTYSCVNATVDAYGRITAMSTGACAALDEYFTFGGCTLQNYYQSGAYCGSTTTLPTPFADSSYFLTCSASATVALPTGTSPGVGYDVTTQITSSSGFTYGIGFNYSGGSPTPITPNVTCHAHHN